MEVSKPWLQGWAWMLLFLVSSLAKVWIGQWQEFLGPPLVPIEKKMKLIKDAIF